MHEERGWGKVYKHFFIVLLARIELDEEEKKLLIKNAKANSHKRF